VNTTARIVILSLASLLACGTHAGSQGGATTPAQSETKTTASTSSVGANTARESIALAAAMHDVAVTEVILDPLGESALTIDEEGGLRLWPTVRGTEIEVPIALPDREPVWATLARGEDGAFVVATIDTQGGARVARIELGEGGAKRTELFEIPAVDPQFELYVLEGAQRIVALGKDHRVRLFDTSGAVKSEIDRVGFIPWQLRVAPTKHGVTPMLAVLTQPVRAQSMRIDHDRLEVVGEAWMVGLDQSPNRNDLALSPDGTKVAALRRPKSKGKAFTLQLIEMATGDRKVILGELDAKVRPRLHYVDMDRALLETGNGTGFWLDLNAAVPKTQTEIPLTPVTPVKLPEGHEDERMQVTVVAGIRAVPVSGGLVIDPIDTPRHTLLTKAPAFANVIAIDHDGARVAWGNPGNVVVEQVGGRAQRFAVDVGRLRALALQESGHVLATGDRGSVIVDEQGATTPGEATAPIEQTARERRKAAEARTAGLALHGGKLLRGEADPTGRFIAVVERTLGDGFDFAGVGEGSLQLSVYDAQSHARLWTRAVKELDELVWSGNGSRLAVAGGGVRVIDAKSGESLLVRTDLGVLAAELDD
jgi:hypothetical protein